MKPLIVAAGLALVWATGYAMSCWIYPFGRCWLCSGAGHHSPRGNARISRPCRWCKATGRRLRIGRRVHNWLTQLRADAR